jgi:ketosteroid isomerase-like protein
MSRILAVVCLFLLLTSVLLSAQASADADAVWALEKDYWRYVQANDLEKYRTLWHEDFLGWPSVSPEPRRKDHITDWITAHTSIADRLKTYDLERLTVQVTGDLATTTYRVRATWSDKKGADNTSTTRIIHTWIRATDGGWKIISGMSAPTNAEGH